MIKVKYVWLSDFVYGGIDGAVTTYAVVAGVHGAQLSVAIILILGFANLLADGFSMAVSKYTSDKAEKDRIQKIRRLEYESIERKPEEERAEIKTILQQQGFTGEALRQAEQVITSNKDRWVQFMIHNEFNVVEEAIYPAKSAVTTFAAFLVVGIIPLLGYLVTPFFPYNANVIFYLTTGFTMLALFFVGTIKSIFSDQHWLYSGLYTVAIGGIAASLAYVVGYVLRGLGAV
ncbi:MAG: VIT1/CCC1 transporter family protein [Candidatus Kerfeldbacteria bacterium]|nr:VIT1/CCC1 transporter family protein [Candidatus Kerfeldbacteria bacterium]